MEDCSMDEEIGEKVRLRRVALGFGSILRCGKTRHNAS
jgi:hypothetical protein